MSAKVIRCQRCSRRMRSPEGWNTVKRLGVDVGYLCPDHQTPEENVGAAVNEATIDYSKMTTWNWREHSPQVNAEFAVRALRQHAEGIWRTFVREARASGQFDVEFAPDRLAEQAWSELPEPWRAIGPAFPDGGLEWKETALDTFRDHFVWLSLQRD